MTKQNGVDVWPNAAIWMRDELRSKVRQNSQPELKGNKNVQSSHAGMENHDEKSTVAYLYKKKPRQIQKNSV